MPVSPQAIDRAGDRGRNTALAQVRQDIFDYIEMFYNPKRKHARNDVLSPVDFENRQRNVNQEGV